jgi:hypothetical protein
MLFERDPESAPGVKLMTASATSLVWEEEKNEDLNFLLRPFSFFFSIPFSSLRPSHLKPLRFLLGSTCPAALSHFGPARCSRRLTTPHGYRSRLICVMREACCSLVGGLSRPSRYALPASVLLRAIYDYNAGLPLIYSGTTHQRLRGRLFVLEIG